MGYQQRKCVMCGADYQPSSSVQKACKPCQPAYTRQRNTDALRRLREARGAVPVGAILMCQDCGDDFEYKSGPQRRCPECQKAHKIRGIHEWLASDKERLSKYADKAKDNYLFGGNRQAALDRDNHTCQHCGSKDDLHVHHIDGNGTTSHKEHRNNVLENLITLCRGCHTRVHFTKSEPATQYSQGASANT